MCDDHVAVQGINVFFNFLASFIIGQFFNTMLCSMQVCLQASCPTTASAVIVYLQKPARSCSRIQMCSQIVRFSNSSIVEIGSATLQSRVFCG